MKPEVRDRYPQFAPKFNGRVAQRQSSGLSIRRLGFRNSSRSPLYLEVAQRQSTRFGTEGSGSQNSPSRPFCSFIMFENATTRTKQGDIGEARAIYEYTRLGYGVSRTLFDSCRYDLIIDDGSTLQRESLPHTP